MIALDLPDGPLTVVVLGAHPDDIEIGCGGTLLTLAGAHQLTVDYVLLTGNALRHREARVAASHFLPGADITFHLNRHARWPAARSVGRGQAAVGGRASLCRPDLVFAPRTDDAHQDHRLDRRTRHHGVAGPLVLHYEIPKWDGDLGRVTHYVTLDEATAQTKIDLLNQCFPSQLGRGWWDDETFGALLRLRGIESQARYAEGFMVAKAVIAVGRAARPTER